MNAFWMIASLGGANSLLIAGEEKRINLFLIIVAFLVFAIALTQALAFWQARRREREKERNWLRYYGRRCERRSSPFPSRLSVVSFWTVVLGAVCCVAYQCRTNVFSFAPFSVDGCGERLYGELADVQIPTGVKLQNVANDGERSVVWRGATAVSEEAAPISGAESEERVFIGEARDVPKTGAHVDVGETRSADKVAANNAGDVASDFIASERVANAENGSKLQVGTYLIPTLPAVSSVEVPTRPTSVAGPTTGSDGIRQPRFDEQEQPSAARRVVQVSFMPERPLLPLPSVFIPETSAINLASADELEKSMLVRLDEEYDRINARVSACVLPIEARKYGNTTSKKLVEETGCGFLMQYSDRIFLLTNRHVVADSTGLDAVKIVLPTGKIIHPTKIVECADFDLAVLELNAVELPQDGSVRLCYFGDSDTLAVANFVGTIGAPFGLENTVTFGRVSSLRRRDLPLNKADKNSLQEFIQLDASINPGNSGGPLYNARGEVVGIVTAIASTSGKNEGVAFAVPINVALPVVKSMIDAGEWRRSQLGVKLVAPTRGDFAALPDGEVSNFRYPCGSKVDFVDSRSPAERVGLKKGDVVVVYNGERVEDDWHLARLIALTGVDERPTLGVLRGARFFEVKPQLVGGSSAK